MNQENGNRRVPDWLLERFAHNDLPAEEATRVRALLALDPEGATRLEQLRASDQQILTTLPPAQVAAEVHRRLHLATVAERTAQASGPMRRLVPLMALGAAGMIALVVSLRPPAPGKTTHATHATTPGGADDSLEITREKGLRPQLIVYRKKGDGRADRLTSGALVRARDVLQVAYVAAGHRHGVIVSVDARGTVTPHLPERAGPAAPLGPRGEIALPHAYELDDSPGFERFLFVTSHSPFSTADVVESLRPGGAPLSEDLSFTELTLRKEIP